MRVFKLTRWCLRPCCISKADRLSLRKVLFLCSGVLYMYHSVFSRAALKKIIEDSTLRSTFLTPKAGKFL